VDPNGDSSTGRATMAVPDMHGTSTLTYFMFTLDGVVNGSPSRRNVPVRRGPGCLLPAASYRYSQQRAGSRRCRAASAAPVGGGVAGAGARMS
jgi:hypothetical protein